MFRKYFAVYFENQMKTIKGLYGRHVKKQSIKTGGTRSYHYHQSDNAFRTELRTPTSFREAPGSIFGTDIIYI
jgi:hypothetical protein